MPNINEEFLNPKSMLTPGIGGGIVMLISQAISNNFDSPLAATTAALSFLVGLLVFVAHSIPMWQRLVYYLLNSLIIFSVAVGTSAAASKDDAHLAAQRTAIQADLAKAAEQLGKIRASEQQLTESLKRLEEQQANAANAAAQKAANAAAQTATSQLGALRMETTAAKKAIEASNDRMKAIQNSSANRFIKKVF